MIGLYKGGTNTLSSDNFTTNQFATSISDNFLTKKDAIDWEKIIDFVSKK